MVSHRPFQGLITQDEDPPPAQIPSHAVHLPDSRRKKTSKCACKTCATKEKRVPFLCLRALVPHPNQIERSRKHARLSKSEEEPCSEKTAPVLDKTLAYCNETKTEHAQREPYMRFESLQDNIRRDFEDDVGYEEDGQGCVILCSGEAEILL